MSEAAAGGRDGGGTASTSGQRLLEPGDSATSAPLPMSSTLDGQASAGELRRGVNLRDVGLLSPKLRKGRLFRSSQAVGVQSLSHLHLQSVIDLRQKAAQCGRAEDEFMRQLQQRAQTIREIPGHLVPEFLKPEYLRTQPVVCGPCSHEAPGSYGHDMQIFHVDLINRGMSWAIFYAMPRFIKYKVLTAVLTCTPPEEIMAPAVADDGVFGYLRLYEVLLDSSKQGWARALRVLTHERHLPALVHCIHGKDRTGVLVMLVALLCGVEEELVVADYIASERMLKEGREDGSLGLPPHLSNDQVIAAKRSVMEHTIAYLHQNYGSAEGYATNIGLTPHEVAELRVALMSEPSREDLLLLGLARPSPIHVGNEGNGPAPPEPSACGGGARPSLSALRKLTLDPRRLFRLSLTDSQRLSRLSSGDLPNSEQHQQQEQQGPSVGAGTQQGRAELN